MPGTLTCALAIVAGLTASGAAAMHADDDLEHGVPASLASDRAARISGLTYDLTFVLPAARQERVTGRAVIGLVLADADRPLALDFAAAPPQVLRVSVGPRVVAHRMANEHIIVPPAALQKGPNTIVIEFEAGDAPLNREDEFLYSLFVPARAREAFPCFDQPDLKARFSLALELPASWDAVSNAPALDRQTEGDRARVRFAPTKPLPTYLFAFAAGRLSMEAVERGGRTFRMFHRETDAARLSRNRSAIFDLHASSLAWLEEYTGIPYPWDSFEFFLVPAFQFSGMEHPGAIYYNAPALLLEETPTKNQLLGRASLIAHETAHMWFGDLVTMKWFDDVWMKEVFANHLAAKIVNPWFPEIDHELRFLYAHYPGAYDVDRTAGTHPIRQPLDNLRDAGTLYGPIIYLKAPIVMRQLERLLGPEGLRDGLREYLQTFAFGNASWPDLVQQLDRRTSVDLAAWSRVWVEEAGRPTVRTEVWTAAGRTVSSIVLLQSDPMGRGRQWPQPLELTLGYPHGVRTIPAAVAGERTELDDEPGSPRPWFVLPNGGGIGYGLFLLDAASLEWLMAHLPQIEDALTRGSAWVTLWDQVLEHRVSPAAFFDLCLRSLAAEADELNVQRILAYTERTYWRLLDADQRAARGLPLEQVLRAGLTAAPTSSLKSAWFRSLVRTATSPDALAWLERVWRKQEGLRGLVLGELDFILLAQELAVRGVPASVEMLDGQQARIDNPDRKARFAFVRPALAADRGVRDAFFASLSDPAARRREPWVLEALEYLHHPLRSGTAEAYVGPSLALLEEIQRTGDIFFPRRWLDATLGGHRSHAVATTVRSFLESTPALSPRLRRIVLQSADELFRIAAMPGAPAAMRP